MPKHIQRRVMQQRADFARSFRTGRISARTASRKPCGAAVKTPWAPRRLPRRRPGRRPHCSILADRAGRAARIVAIGTLGPQP